MSLKPIPLNIFIPEKLYSFQNAVVDIFDIWGASAQKLSSKIDREKSDKIKIEHIENFLLQKLIRPKESVIDSVVGKVIHSKGFIEVNDLANYAALSAPQFRKRFREEIGISPSQYCKIIRVNASLSIIKRKAYNSLTEITYNLGYYDQSHFIKDFKSVMGQSPKAFLTTQVF